jgi:hypothetical protein
MNIVEVENAQKLTTEAIGWSPVLFMGKKKSLEQSHTQANQALDKKFGELQPGAPAEAKESFETSVRMRGEALQLFEKAAKMFKIEFAKDACKKMLESFEHGLKAIELAEGAKV